jgi:shikimate 5-dehydrogenase
MIDEGILTKESRLIALYGVNAQTSPFLKVLNTTFKQLGLNDFAIGLNIKPEDFAYMVKGMPNSKVRMALYEPEYYEEVVPLLDVADSCTQQSRLCDGAYAHEGKLIGHCFYAKAFSHLIRYENLELQGKRILLLGAGAMGRALLSSLGAFEPASIEVADSSVERAAEALEMAKPTLIGVDTDISWLQSGMDVDGEAYDLIINAVDLYAHRDKRLIHLNGSASSLTLIDFVRGESAFDRLSEELGCRKIGASEWMVATALSVADEWLGGKPSVEDYMTILKA